MAWPCGLPVKVPRVSQKYRTIWPSLRWVCHSDQSSQRKYRRSGVALSCQTHPRAYRQTTTLQTRIHLTCWRKNKGTRGGTLRFGWTRDKTKERGRQNGEIEGWATGAGSVAATIASWNFRAHVLVTPPFYLGAASLRAQYSFHFSSMQLKWSASQIWVKNMTGFWTGVCHSEAHFFKGFSSKQLRRIAYSRFPPSSLPASPP